MTRSACLGKRPAAPTGRLPVAAGPTAEPRQRIALLAFSLAAAIALQLAGAPLAGPGMTILSCIAILLLGLPHGALDIALIQHDGEAAARGLLPVIALYVGCALSALAVWMIAPVAALALFLVLAVAHFAEDWKAAGSPFLAVALAAALLTAPALLNQGALHVIFAALTGRPQGGELSDILLLAAPPALCGGLVAIAALARAGRGDLAAAAGFSLTALLILPPALGFALFFGLCHSPRHFKEALRTLSRRRVTQWLPVAAPTTIAALAIGAALYRWVPAGGASTRLTSATFTLLWVLTVPHMLVPLILRVRRRGQLELMAASRAAVIAGAIG